MRIWNFIRGYVIIRIEGLSFERLFNLAADNGIYLSDTDRVSYTNVDLLVSAAHYRKLKKILPHKYSMTVLKKAGIPFIFQTLWARKALLFGLLIIAGSVIAASMFVWEVRITGIDDSYDIKKELESLGIEMGTLKKDIDTGELERHFIIEHDEIAWIDMSLKGVVLYVEIVPSIPVPDVWDENTPCNIIAKKDGYITSVTALSGRAKVEVGDTVRKGDMLISGQIWDEGKDRLLFAARGEVFANVWYAAAESKPLFEETRVPTGRVQLQRIIVIGADWAKVDPGCDFAEYDTKIVDEYYVGARMFLPVKVVTYEHSEVTIEKEPMSIELIRVILEEKAYHEAASKAPENAQVLGHRTFFEVGEEYMKAIVYIETEQDIGKVVYIKE